MHISRIKQKQIINPLNEERIEFISIANLGNISKSEKQERKIKRLDFSHTQTLTITIKIDLISENPISNGFCNRGEGGGGEEGEGGGCVENISIPHLCIYPTCKGTHVLATCLISS